MNGLVMIKNNDVFTDSIVIAEGTGNQHESVVRILNTYTKDFEEFGKLYFTDLKSGKRGRPVKIYTLNEPQASLLVTYLDNNEVVRRFKIKLIKEFYNMRQLLMQKQSISWSETRDQGKLTRRAETDVLKDFIEYATDQGSSHAEKYYMVFSKLANKIACVPDRNMATILELNNLNLIESIILKVVRQEMDQGTHYKEIYRKCEKRLNQFADIAYLSA